MNEITPRQTKEISPWQIQRLGETDAAEFASAPQSEARGPRDHWNVVVKHRRLVVSVFLAVFVISAYTKFTATPLYTAGVMLQILPQNPTITGLAEILSNKSEGTSQYDYYQTQFVLLQSRALAARVITSLGLASDPAFNQWPVSGSMLTRILGWIDLLLDPFITYGTQLYEFMSAPSPSKDAAEPLKNGADSSVAPILIYRYQGFLKVTPVKNTRLVVVTFDTPDPALSQKLANAHASGYIRMNIDSRSALTEEAREFLDKKNDELRAKLERSEEALNRFRQTHGVVSLEKGENIVVDRLVALNSQLTVAKTQRIDAESLYRTVANKKYQDLSQIMIQGSIPQLKTNLATLDAEYARLATIFKPDHPRLQELGEHINAARRNLNSEVANVVRGIESSYVAARAREQALEAEAKKQEETALNQKQIGVQYAVLQEEVNVNRSLYESVLKRLSETNVSNDLAISNVEIIQRAELPRLPTSAQTARSLLIGAAMGLFLGVGIAFLLDYLDTTMHTPEDVERAVSLNTLGVVPDLRILERLQIDWENGDRPILKALKGLSPLRWVTGSSPPNEFLLTKHPPQSIFSESYRFIRTSLLLSRAERPPQVILLTSASPGEGKTGTSLNLGIALAQDGHRVLVVDADLRKGCCHNLLGMINHKGLSNILSGNLALEEGIQPTPISGLSLLSCGVCASSPADLLGSSKMREVLTRLRESFDFIVIDTPPAIALTDAAVLSAMSDGVVLVFHGQKTTTLSARRLIERLDTVRAPVLGVVLNGVDLQNPNFAYYSHYRSYYSHTDATVDESKNGNGLDKLLHQLEPKSNFDHLATGGERQTVTDATDALAGNDTIEEASEKDSETAANFGSPAESEQEQLPEPVVAGATDVVNERSPEDTVGADLMPQESLDRLIAAVTKSIGPTAPLVVREQIGILGESYDAFPKRRIGELVKLLESEIIQRTKTSLA